ncbi:MAG TPA: purine-nucleoside phosphorylase [Bacteroidetes bacterium]|nr:purine-nucleoside phosphorylase [Bacteroidota bacterium]HRR07612.1 purine-nucleoside phosphorylase [Rhodothermales bacterium]
MHLQHINRYREKVSETATFLLNRISVPIDTALIIGTGLGALADEITEAQILDYAEIPHFPVSTVESHTGKLHLGKLAGRPIMALQGRFHVYEGYSPQEITFPVRVMAQMGIRNVLISNAAGGLNPLYKRGDLMLIHDHINLMFSNPLVGPNMAEWGPRFPDMSEPYTPELRFKALELALKHHIQIHQGVYAVVSGPNLETKAEYRFLRQIGGDAIGMSTVPEVIVATHMGLRLLAVSVITDECLPDALQPVSMKEIVEAAEIAEPKLATLMRGLVAEL